MTKHYIFNEKTGKCFTEGDNKELNELEAVSNNAFQWVYKDKCCFLTIEKKAKHIISATLKTACENKAVEQWEDIDKGQAVYSEEKQGYILEYNRPKIFYLFKNDYKKRSWKFNFAYQWHLILKDKDDRKPYYWYYYDYTEELSTFIYETLKYHIKVEMGEGEIVALPAEQGQAVQIWSELGYSVNDYYCGEDEEYKDYDFSKETAENWRKNNLPPALIITFLPTYFKNYELGRGAKLTGTTWFKKIWEVFGARGVPIVLKCYRAFIFINLYRHYPQLYQQISSITELPAEIDGREIGKSNLLVYFNMPWLPKKINYKRYKS